MNPKHVQAVIVGAGAGGGVVAKELASGGLSVVLLERGKWYSAADCRKDDLHNQRTAVLGNGFGPDDDGNPRVLVDERGEHVVDPSDPGYSNNAACVGGGTFSYGAMAWRFMEQDFRMRSTYGAVEGSTLDDWPIGYNDLEPYYEKAEWEMGVSGDDTGNIFKAPRKKPLPMPPLAPNKEYQVLHPAAQRLGLHPFDVPMLRNTVPYNGRRSCMRCRWCVGFACEVDARTGTHNTVIPTALATGNCELRTGCMTKEILLDERGRARGVTYIDADGRYREQTADLVIVCGGAIESARLLLNTRHRVYPAGLGNRYDWVGRNLQSHSYTGAVGLFDFDTYDDLGPGASIAISDYNHGNPGLAGGGMLANEFIRLPYQFMGLVPPWIARWGPEHKDFVRAGDASVRFSRAGRSESEGSLGHSGGTPVRTKASPYHRDRALPRRQSAGVADRSWSHQHLAPHSRPRLKRRTAPGRDLPDGQRSQDFRGRSRLPHPRCRQRLCNRREQPRHQRRLQPRADHSGQRLPRLQ